MTFKLISSLKAKKEVSIKHMLHRELAGYEPPRDDSYIHASDLMKAGEYCPREWALYDLGLAKKKGFFVGTSQAVTFAQGRDVERRIRNDWLRKYMVGNWSCEVCGHVHSFGKEPKGKCPKCGWGGRWEYLEPRVSDPVSGISGGIDGLVDVGGLGLRVLEIKIMAPDEHKSLAAPLAEHKFRTSLYLRLASAEGSMISDQIDQNEASILYVSRSFGFKDTTLAENGIKDSPFSPFKEFAIKRDDALSDVAVSKASALTMWRKWPEEQKSGGPCGVCTGAFTKRAQQCPAVSACFSGKLPSIITWVEGGKPRHEGKPIVAGL